MDTFMALPSRQVPASFVSFTKDNKAKHDKNNRPCMLVKETSVLQKAFNNPDIICEYALPLTSVDTSVTINESVALISMAQTFENPKQNNCPVELTYRFPKLKQSFISQLTIRIGNDRVIEATV